MQNLYVEETFVNATEQYIAGDSGVYETFTADTGELFRSLRREHGRCTGKMFIDTAKAKSRQIGWVFLKRRPYRDTNESYLAETWVSVHRKQPDIVKKSHYADFGSRDTN